MHTEIHSAAPRKGALGSISTGLRAGQTAPARPPTRSMRSEAGEIELLDSIDLNEATLAKMTADQAETLAQAYPGLRVAPELMLYPMRLRPAALVSRPTRVGALKAIRSLTIRCVDGVSGRPVPNADLVIVLDREKRAGIKDVATDAAGTLTTPLPAARKVVDMIVCAPRKGYWPAFRTAIALAREGQTEIEIPLVPIAADHKDALHQLVSGARPDDGKGVKIGIVDSGVTPGPEVKVVKGLNTTGSEPADQWLDGDGHGTHVAGIVARIAPAAELFAYRVFEAGAPSASEFAIAKAIRQAVDDDCDVINLSLGQSSEPFAITREVRRARAFGVVCVAATGNDRMAAVSYPARTASVAAVTAAGVLGSWPEGAMTGENVADRPGPVGTTFFGAFSNVGPEVDFIGPGVGIISWVGDKDKGVMDGTSMACPAVSGLIARCLSRNPAVLKADRDQQRSDDMIKQAKAIAAAVGFGSDYEGAGLIAVP